MNLFIVSMSIMMSIVCSIAFGQHGVGPDWSSPISIPSPTIANDVKGNLYSNMTVTPTGKRVVILNKTTLPGFGPYFSTSSDGINWNTSTTRIPIFGLTIGASNYRMIADSNYIHCTWTSKVPHAIYYSRLDHALNVLVDSIRIDSDPSDVYAATYLSTDKNGGLHLMWHSKEVETSIVISEIIYTHSIDGGLTWINSQTISSNSGQSGFPRGQFSACNGDTLAIAWRTYESGPGEFWDIAINISTDGGVSWLANSFKVYDMSLPNPAINNQWDPDVVVGPFGRIHIMYHLAPNADPLYGTKIRYTYSDDLGTTWTNPFSNISTIGIRSLLAEGMRYDEANDILWGFWKETDFYLGLEGADIISAYSTDRGDTWAIEYSTDHDTLSVGYKSVDLLPNGNVIINYDFIDENGELFVNYIERQMLVTGLVENTEYGNSFTVYPNPFSETVTVDFGELKERVTILVIDVTGMIIHHEEFLKTKNVVVNLCDYSQGVYFLKLIDEGNQSTTFKVINK